MFNVFKKKHIEKTLGQWGEEIAQKEYKKQGYKIVGTNIFNRRGKRAGEIDFIAKDKKVIVFVEVKTRTSGIDRFGKGAESVNVFKQRKLLKAVKIYLRAHPDYASFRPQIDVCLVEVDPSTRLRVKGEETRTLDKPQYSVKIIRNAVEDWN